MSYGQYSNDYRGKQNPLKHERGDDTPRRQVFPSDEVPHLWAHQRQSMARNAQGNLYFRGPTIYSYRDNWPLARIYTRPNGTRLVLTNSDRYSVTTSQHQSDVNRAASHLPQVAVPHVGAMSHTGAPDHAQNIAYLLNTAAEHLKKAQRALSVHAVRWSQTAARDAYRDAQGYVDFFRIRRKVPAFPAAEWAAANARAERIENPDPKAASARERARAQRKAANAARDEYLEAQRASIRAAKHAKDFYRIGAARTSFRLADAWGTDYEALRSSACMLRVEGCGVKGCTAQPCDHAEQIETSWGARVPLAAAPMVWRYVQAVRNRGGAWASAQTGRLRIGDYPLDRIDADGTLHAGCHTIPYSELRAMARTLNLT